MTGQLLSMHLEELQTRETALITAIEACPEIAEGEGSVVTGRFLTREVHELVHVEVLAANGERETLSGTSIHPIWSVDRNDWVPLGELVIGETLHGAAGLARVLGLTVASATTTVYNIEVHGHHVYQVGKIGLLVHNTYPGSAVSRARNPSTIRFSQDSARHTFSDGRSIGELVEGLQSGRVKPGDVPPIRLVERDGHLISVDNRRLEAFRRAGVHIPTRMATPAEIEQAIRQGKFSAGPLGSPTIRIRGENP